MQNSAIEGYNQYHYGSIKPSIGQITSSLLEQSNVSIDSIKTVRNSSALVL